MGARKTNGGDLKPQSSKLTNFFVAALATLCVSLTPTRATDEPPEWTLEQARQCWQPMVRPVQHMGVPGYRFQTAALWDGTLVFGPLDFRQLKVMQAELAPLGETRLHVSVGVGEAFCSLDRKGTGYLLHDRHSRSCAAFGDILRSAGIEPLVLSPRSPNLNAHSHP